MDRRDFWKRTFGVGVVGSVYGDGWFKAVDLEKIDEVQEEKQDDLRECLRFEGDCATACFSLDHLHA